MYNIRGEREHGGIFEPIPTGKEEIDLTLAAREVIALGNDGRILGYTSVDSRQAKAERTVITASLDDQNNLRMQENVMDSRDPNYVKKTGEPSLAHSVEFWRVLNFSRPKSPITHVLYNHLHQREQGYSALVTALATQVSQER